MIATEALPALDRAHFDMMTASDAALQSEIAGLFRGQTDDWRCAIGAPVDPEWGEALHRLKGSARGIGLSALAQACEDAERAGFGHAAQSSAIVLTALENALRALAAY